jgi:hypothetical protein
MLNRCSVPPPDPPSKRDRETVWEPLRRRSLGALGPLESCNIGVRESKNHVVRRNSLPVAPFGTAPLPKLQTSWFPDPGSGSVQPDYRPSELASVLWPDESRPTSQTIQSERTIKPPNWRQLCTTDSASKKRRLEGQFSSAEAQRRSEASQISPRTIPVSTLPNEEGSSRNSAIDTSDMSWIPYLPTTQPSNKPLLNVSSGFDLDSFQNLDFALNQSRPRLQNMRIDITPPNDQKPPTNSLQQSRFGQFEPQNIWQQNISQVPVTSQAQHWPACEPTQSSQAFQTKFQQARPQNSPSSLPSMPMNMRSVSSQPSTSLSQNLTTISRPVHMPLSQHQGLQFQGQQISPSLRSTHASVQTPQTAPADLLRKPSLYKIPAWSSPTEVGPVQITTATSSLQSLPSVSDAASNQKFKFGIKFGAIRQPTTSMQPDKNHDANFEARSDLGAVNAFSSKTCVAGAKTDVAEIPRTRTGRKHCPNLYVRIQSPISHLANRLFLVELLILRRPVKISFLLLKSPTGTAPQSKKFSIPSPP